MYWGGPRVREVFKSLHETLDHEIEADNYNETLKLLNGHFMVKPNETFQRHRFRKLVQLSTETVAQYIKKSLCWM